MQRIVRLLVFLLVPLPACAQVDVVAAQVKILTAPGGWAVSSKYSIAEGTFMKDMLAGVSPCDRSDQLIFSADGTYERVYHKTGCANASLKNTKGTWKYDVDPDIEQGMVALHIIDQVDPRLSADYLVVTIDELATGDYSGLILAPLPDQNTPEKTVLIYSPYKGAAPQTPAMKGGIVASANPLLLALSSLNDEVVGQAGKNLDDVFDTNLRNEEFRIVEYSNKETGTGPYYLINYKGNKKEEYLCDIQTDYTGSRVTIYSFKVNAWKEATEELLGKDFESQNVSRAFDRWLAFTQVPVTIDKSEQSYIYSLGPDNFLTLNPSIMVELNVTWVDSEKKEQADARVVAKIEFDGQKFVWTWQE